MRRLRLGVGYTPPLLVAVHAIVIEVLLLRFPHTRTPAERLTWMLAVAAQLVVILYSLAAWLEARAGHQPGPDEAAQDGHGRQAPDIDVFVTVCGEPLDTVIPVVRAARDMDVPHTTWVLDDGADDDLRRRCQQERVAYLRRSTRKYGKAGNINHALRCTRGDLVAVFDADQRPDKAFLSHVMGYFSDDAVAFVQTPQHYVYRTPMASRGARQSQRTFYRYIMPGKARHNAAFCVGTNVVFRRAALDAIEGIPEGSNSEDIHTSLRLHSSGWRSVFVPEVLALGQPPHDWPAYLRQQRRWACGAFEVLLAARLWRRAGLDARQRWHYLMIGTHYLVSIIHLSYSLFPAGYLLLGLSPVSVRPVVLLLVMLSMLASVAAANRLQTGRWGVAAGLTSTLAAPAHLLGLVNAVTRHRQRWVPTHHADSPRRVDPSSALVGVLACLNGAAMAMGMLTGAARLGFVAPAAALGMASAADHWVLFPLIVCATQAGVFLIPSAARLHRWLAAAPARRAVRYTTVAVPTVAAVTAVVLMFTMSHLSARTAPELMPSFPAAAVWRDDFAGTAGAPPSADDWVIDTGHHYPGGPPNWGTGEIQEYTRSPENLRLDGNGNLVITATERGGGAYRSARIETRRDDFIPPEHGTLRMQARVRLPAARGTWTTFWALGRSYRNDLRWPDSGEIDAIEYRGSRPSEVYGVLHCPGCGEPVGMRSSHQVDGGLTNKFHTYTVDWHHQPDRIDWYVDGHRYQSITRNMLDDQSWVFDQPVFLLLNVAVGGYWPGAPHPDDYPASMTVDYVEVRTCPEDCPMISPSGEPR